MIDEGKTIADVEEEYEAVVKVTVKAKSAEEAQAKIETFFEESKNDVITDFEFIDEEEDA